MIRPGWPRRGVLADLAAVASFVLLAFWVMGRVWTQRGVGFADNPADQAFFEWVLSHGARVFAAGENPFHSIQMGYPDGVNLMANTNVLGISLPLTPITLLAGPRVALYLVITLGLAGTATSWYFVLSRPLLGSRLAGWVGGLFCGFAPAMVSQSNAHPNLTSQILVPVLVWRAFKLREEGRWLRNGLWLALVAVLQFFVSSELLLLTAVGVAIALIVLVATRPALLREWRPFAAGLAVAGGVALVVLAYPLWVQFNGPGAYARLPDGYLVMGADPVSYLAFARQSLAGSAGEAQHLAFNPTEENSFLGWPLVAALVVVVVALRRLRLVWALVAVVLVAAVFSLGPWLIRYGYAPTIPMPWQVFQQLPLLGSIVPVRWGLVVTAAVGVLLAVAVVEARRHSRRATRVLGVLLVAALVPLFPKPLPTVRLDDPPPFLAAGGPWRDYTAGGRSLMFLPMANDSHPDPIRWSAEQHNEMVLAQGYFLTRGAGGKAISSSPPRALSRWLGAMEDGEYWEVTPSLQRKVRTDLRYWRVGAVVALPQKDDDAQPYVRAMTELLGRPPREVDGVRLWDVRSLSR